MSSNKYRIITPLEKKYVITISYADCYRDGGGTSKACLSQIEILKENGISAISLSAFDLGGKFTNERLWLVRCDGNVLAVWSTKDFLKYIDCLQDYGFLLGGILIHHLKRAELNEMMDIVLHKGTEVLFYLHDYYTICPFGNGNLILDGKVCRKVEYDLAGCKTCKNFSLKKDLINIFIEKISQNATFIAPSTFCKNTWIKGFPEYADKVSVYSHQKLEGEYKGNIHLLKPNQKVKVAFVGAQIEIKGWNDFKDLVYGLGEFNKDYEFYYLGAYGESISNVKKIYVNFQDGQQSMINAIRENKIDVVCLLSKCPETYSYTYYESMASNAFVLTYKESGNICYQVIERKNGIVFDDYSQLFGFLLDSKNLYNSINEFRKRKIYGPSELIVNDSFVELLRFNNAEKNRNTNIMPNNKSLLKFLYTLKGYIRHQK